MFASPFTPMVKISIMEVLPILLLIINFSAAAPFQTKDTNCAHKVADVIFAIDSSKSIWEEDFVKQLHFVQSLVKDFPISPSGIHVGVVTYGHDIHKNFGLQDYYSVPEVTSAIDLIQYVGGGTNTGGVIKYARERMFDTENGGRNVDQIMIVITDGYSMNNENTTKEASISKTVGIKMISVGVGHNVDETELRYIASKDGGKRLKFRVDDFSTLGTIQTILAKAACQAIHTDDIMVGDEGYKNKTELDTGTVKQYCGGKPADVFFVVDASSSILSNDFQKMKEFIADTVDTFDLKPNRTRVGVVVYSNGADAVIDIDNETDIAKLKTEILRIPHLKGGTETGKALKYLRTHGFAKGFARDGVAHIAILLTDGQSTDIRQTLAEARSLKQAGTYIYVIGIGRQVDDDELKAIASDPDEHFVYMMDNYDALSSIQNILAYRLCGGTVEDETSAPVPMKECEPFSNLNVMYVYDAFSIGKTKSERFIKLIDGILARTNNPRIRSGVLAHSCYSIKNIPFTNNVHGREQLEGLMTRQSDTLPLLLHDVRTNIANTNNVDDSDALNVIVLFVDGNLDYYRRLKMAIKRVTFGDMAIVYVIGVGEKLDDAMEDLASVSTNAYFVQINENMDVSTLSDLLGETICDSDMQAILPVN